MSLSALSVLGQTGFDSIWKRICSLCVSHSRVVPERWWCFRNALYKSTLTYLLTYLPTYFSWYYKWKTSSMNPTTCRANWHSDSVSDVQCTSEYTPITGQILQLLINCNVSGHIGLQVFDTKSHILFLKILHIQPSTSDHKPEIVLHIQCLEGKCLSQKQRNWS